MTEPLPGFSIVTPSYRMLDGLELCAASIADQEGVRVQHIIQDNCSPGMDLLMDKLDDLQSAVANYRHEVHVKPDTGIYQAVNRGLRRAQYDYLAYLNCDEQYLPGTLQQVAEFYEAHPKVDVAFGDLVFIDEKGEPLHYQKTILPRESIIRASHLPAFTCATFFRKRVFEALPFREDLKALADAYWVLDLIRRETPMALLEFPTSVFTCSETNVSASAKALAEKATLRKSAPLWQQRLRPLISWAHRCEKALAGCYQFPPFDYEIYRPGLAHRLSFPHGSRR